MASNNGIACAGEVIPCFCLVKKAPYTYSIKPTIYCYIHPIE